MDFKKEMERAGVIGCHFEKMMPEIRIKALTDFPILIIGETGTGKELVAQLIHRMSRRKEKPLQFVNVPAISNGIFESELFGHEKGAFTDASRSRKGLLRENDGGTIVLDEIGDMSPEMQVKILRWLENGEIKPVGSDKVIFVDVRVIASTNKDLGVLVEEGLFRKDLYYRLQDLSIEVLPLRKDKRAVLDLAKHFVDKNKEQFFDFYEEMITEPGGNELHDLFEELISAITHCSNFLAGGNARELESYVRNWLFKRAYRHSTERSVSPIHQPVITKEFLEKPTSKDDLTEKDTVFIGNIRKALILCKGNTKNAAVFLECSEEELLELITNNNISIDKDGLYSVDRNDIETIKSLQSNHQEEDSSENCEWLQKINCNFLNPSEDELNKIRDVLNSRLEVVEKRVIQMSVNHFDGNLKKVRNSLGIGYKKLEDRIKKYNIAVLEHQDEANPGPLKEVLLMEEIKLIKFLLKKGMSAKNIARSIGIHLNTVYRRIRDCNLAK
ncbi:MAG TPA: hypothetical protein ENJ27_01790 [Candidatus Moranbacteria bacterium]|nr:hypothetical protein [Candidatus Moranbacteria bacterium]